MTAAVIGGIVAVGIAVFVVVSASSRKKGEEDDR